LTFAQVGSSMSLPLALDFVFNEGHHDFRLCSADDVQADSGQTGRVLARSVPSIPVDAPMIATGLSSKQLLPRGRDSQSVTLLSAPEME
jgi:hypothetical protein